MTALGFIVVALATSAAVSACASTTTTTTTTTTTAAADSTSAGQISAGPSRSECLTPNTANGQTGLSYLQTSVDNFDTETGTTVTCLTAYLSGAPNWYSWEHPWVTNPANGYTTWVAQRPASRDLVLAVNLIPTNLDNVNNPSKWERTCANGGYDAYATALGTSLVRAGLQNSVIRLGTEMNGVWEGDFIGTKVSEQRTWAKCFANEVTGLRKATGGHFLIDWNVNACIGDYGYANYYPGNAYVDILGLDLYDVGCQTPTTSLTFKQLANEQLGLNYFEAFAKAKGKPMSFPEWGLSTIPAGDDPGYINGMGAAFEKDDFAFESYFEGGGTNVKALSLGPDTPLSIVAFKQWFGPAQ
jgi:hypothetical protein